MGKETSAVALPRTWVSAVWMSWGPHPVGTQRPYRRNTPAKSMWQYLPHTAVSGWLIVRARTQAFTYWNSGRYAQLSGFPRLVNGKAVTSDELSPPPPAEAWPANRFMMVRPYIAVWTSDGLQRVPVDHFPLLTSSTRPEE
jgi:hypothetical protein